MDTITFHMGGDKPMGLEIKDGVENADGVEGTIKILMAPRVED